jgi:hypothetical protein
MNSGIEPLRAAILRGHRIAEILALQAGIVTAPAGNPVGGRIALPGELRDHLLDRSARRKLDHRKRDRHDADNGRDHQQQAAKNIRAHQPTRRMPVRATAVWRGLVPVTDFKCIPSRPGNPEPEGDSQWPNSESNVTVRARSNRFSVIKACR